MQDNVGFAVGNALDFSIEHNGTDTTITENTGNLTIKNNADDGDIVFQSDNGSGGLATYFKLAGSVTNTIFEQNARFLDTIELRFGTSNDLKIHHNGSNSIIENEFGDLYIQQKADDGDIIFKCDDGSGGTTEYFRLDGAGTPTIEVSVHTNFYDTVNLDDNVMLALGTGNDLQIKHTGSESTITNNVGQLTFIQNANDNDIVFKSDNGSGGTAEYFKLDGSATRTVFSKEANFEDSVKLTFGAQPGGDLQIYHDGSNSYIDEPGTGALNIRSNSVVAGKYTGEVLFRGTADGAFEAFYDNSVKLSTTNTGIDVSGAIEMDKSLTMAHISDPSDPATGHSVMWSDTSGNLKIKINVGGSVVTRTLATGSD